MRKRLSAGIVGIIVSGCFLMASCDSGRHLELIFATEHIKYNVEGSQDFGFSICMLTPNKNTVVEFTGFTGEGIDTLRAELVDETYPFIRDLNSGGYYLRLLGFLCHTQSSYTVLSGVDLEIDGKATHVDFENPVLHKLREPFPDEATYLEYPVIISTYSPNNVYNFVWQINSPITVDGFGFNDYFDVNESTVTLGGEIIGSLATALPVESGTSDMVVFTCSLKRKGTDPSPFDWVYCDFVLSYTAAGKPVSVHGNIVGQGVSTEEDALAFIEEMLK